MERRKFIQSTLQGTVLAYLPPFKIFAGINGEKYPELKKHKITKVERIKYDFHWPRHVGKNSRLDYHGQYKSDEVFKLHTDQGAMGWALGQNRLSDEEFFQLKGKLVSDLISPEKGLRQGLSPLIDLALHDLMGVILNKPVYKILGEKGTKNTPIYSGMIYFDEMEYQGITGGIDKILENCKWDIDYGYRQLKVKIGRSGKWYPHDEGLRMDIEVMNQIHSAFPDITLLVDPNNAYSLQDTIDFLNGIDGIPLLWMEEPFAENYEEGRKLRNWMDKNGFKDTLYADGEYKPNHALCMKMGKEGIMNAYLPDIRSYGFTWWRNLIPQLKEYNMLASPHAFGNMLKTHYISHIAAAFGNVVTIEGVTCLSDNIDYGDYRIESGEIQVSDAPGFGMKLLK
jgi:L-alanine-DL-glutamate epimerase-like enolase superfamily enzyme